MEANKVRKHDEAINRIIKWQGGKRIFSGAIGGVVVEGDEDGVDGKDRRDRLERSETKLEGRPLLHPEHQSIHQSIGSVLRTVLLIRLF